MTEGVVEIKREKLLVFASTLLLLEVLVSNLPVLVSECQLPFYRFDADSLSSNVFYQDWRENKRVEPDFHNYFNSSGLYFKDYFQHLYQQFAIEIDSASFDEKYRTPVWRWSHPMYAPGCAPLNLEPLANFVVWKNPMGIIFEMDTSTSQNFTDGDTDATNEINWALGNVTSSGGIVFIKAGTYRIHKTLEEALRVFRNNTILAGEGWATALSLTDNSNTSLIISKQVYNIIIRDLMLNANRWGNLDAVETNAINMRSFDDGNIFQNASVENVYVVGARRFGLFSRRGWNVHFLNNVIIDSGWNGIEHCWSSYSSAVANFVTEFSDVGISTWASHHLVLRNNYAINARNIGLGYNNAGWALGFESSHVPPWDTRPTHHILAINNVFSNNTNVVSAFKGNGVWFMRQSYAIALDNNKINRNNRWGIHFERSSFEYPDDTIIVQNNDVRDNNIGGAGENISIDNRPGIVIRNNLSGQTWHISWSLLDEDDNDVAAAVTYELWNYTQQLSYDPGECSLLMGNYTLKIFYLGELISATNIPTWMNGNATTTVRLHMVPHSSISNGYIAFNDTVSAIMIYSQTSRNLVFGAVAGAPAYKIVINVPENATSIKKDGANLAYGTEANQWNYANQAIRIRITSLGLFEISFSDEESAHSIVPTDVVLAIMLSLTLLSLFSLTMRSRRSKTHGRNGCNSGMTTRLKEFFRLEVNFIFSEGLRQSGQRDRKMGGYVSILRSPIV